MLERNIVIKNTFLAARQAAILAAKYEAERVQKRKPPWLIYGSTLYEHEHRFKGVLDGVCLADFCQSKKEAFGSVYGLEVCGDGEVLRNIPSLDGGVAITLGDFRSSYQKVHDKEHNLNLVIGDVLDKVVWKQVSSFLESREKEGFDLVIMSPVGGWETMGGGHLNGLLPEIEWFVINRLWRNLSSQRGIMLAQFRSQFPEKIEQWANQLVIGHNVEVRYEALDQALKLIRGKSSPRSLPKL